VSAETEKKILVVDDELDTRIFLFNLLNASGFSPITASNKAEGLRRVVIERPSIIILNMMMPGESGIRLYQHLKQDEALRRIPVIMLSTLNKDTFLRCRSLYGYWQREDSELIDKFMEKPVEADELLMTVQEMSNQAFRLEPS
jgi:CheY-like chemotaxis protein